MDTPLYLASRPYSLAPPPTTNLAGAIQIGTMPRRLPPINPMLTPEHYAALAVESCTGFDAAETTLSPAIAAGVEKATADFLLGRDGGDDMAEEGPVGCRN